MGKCLIQHEEDENGNRIRKRGKVKVLNKMKKDVPTLEPLARNRLFRSR
jgi:hypothetical protein